MDDRYPVGKTDSAAFRSSAGDRRDDPGRLQSWKAFIQICVGCCLSFRDKSKCGLYRNGSDNGYCRGCAYSRSLLYKEERYCIPYIGDNVCGGSGVHDCGSDNVPGNPDGLRCAGYHHHTADVSFQKQKNDIHFRRHGFPCDHECV